MVERGGRTGFVRAVPGHAAGQDVGGQRRGHEERGVGDHPVDDHGDPGRRPPDDEPRQRRDSSPPSAASAGDWPVGDGGTVERQRPLDDADLHAACGRRPRCRGW